MDGNTLSAQVADLEFRHTEAMDLLGMVLATLNLERNRKHLDMWSIGQEINKLSAQWWERFQAMRNPAEKSPPQGGAATTV